MIKYAKQFQSYEGEGPKIGLKTLFLTYDNNKGEGVDWNAFYRQQYRPQALYLNTEHFDKVLFENLELMTTRFESLTCEISLENLLAGDYHNKFHLFDLPGSWFLRVTESDITKLDCNAIIDLDRRGCVNFKIEAKNDAEFGQKIDLANLIGELRKNISVYLMPLYSEGVGKYMEYALPLISPNVRVMPPTQFLIGMK